MNWNEKCLLELTHHNMFESTEHRLRFRDLINCYYTALFFNRGLCKCMYLLSWDDEHFIQLLGLLNEMTINESRNLKPMIDETEDLAREDTGSDAELYKLTVSFITRSTYQLPDFAVMDPDYAHMIRCGLLASQYIDELPDPQESRSTRG